jgi:methylmalonyl-CoA/ethylmalonyl-CoA epimerase
MPEAIFKGVLQVGLVVRDLDAAVRTYADEYGIGPWKIYDVTPAVARNLTQYERPSSYSMRVALAMIGTVQWELIEPLDETGVYADFLRARGEGLHHVAFEVDDYAGAIDSLRDKGHRVLMGGQYQGASWAYLSTDEKLGVISEVFDLTGVTEQKPDAVYPPSGAASEPKSG